MTREFPSRLEILSRVAELLGLHEPHSPARLVADAFEALQRASRQQLLEWARRLDLTGIQRMTRDALAEQCQAVLHALGAGEPAGAASRPAAAASPGPGGIATRGEPSPAGAPPDLARRFELGPAAGTQPLPAHIPWGYGQDRVTAMMVDPDRLYVYWEITDDAMARARENLGPAGREAWVNLRVYDVSGRLFDGTNAHSYVDQRVERTDRQWFFDINKPTSTAIVDLGLRSSEGYFVRVARSGRVDFPRRAPVPSGDARWLSVRTATGAVDSPVAGGHVDPRPHAPAWHASDADGTQNGGELLPDERFVSEAAFAQRWEWEESFRTVWHGGEPRLEWRGPVERTTWEAGPFAHSVDSLAYVEEEHPGTVSVAHHDGHTQVVYGPWQVVIRGLEAHAERRVVATWRMEARWEAPVDVEGSRTSPGASGQLGASERRWLRGSEVRLGGASEVWRLGASERRYLGASERRLHGASEWAQRGASERRLGGGSERAYGGGSERLTEGGAPPGALGYPSAAAVGRKR